MATLALDSEESLIVTGAHEEVLSRISQRGAALAIFRRKLPASLEEEIHRLDLDPLDSIDVAVDLPLSVQAFAASLVASGYPAVAALRIAADVIALAHRHAAICAAERVRIRLEIIETDACRKFHADYVSLRLLTTYRGQGSQWCRASDPGTVHQLAAGEVAIFKGRTVLDNPPILHRSPPIAATGEQRLLLAIDPLTK